MGFQSYVLNTRRPVLPDWRVRKAINLAFDFEAINVYRQYKRTNSVFSNTPFAMTGMPGPGELALLEPFRNELPPEVFGPRVGAAAQRHVPERAAREPEAGEAAARVRRAGTSTPTASRATPRASRSSSSSWRRATRRVAPRPCSQRNLAKIGIRPEVAPRRLLALPQADRDVRLRHDDDPDRRLHAARPAELKSQYGAQERGRPGRQQLPRREEPGRRPRARRDGEGADDTSELTDAARALDRLLMLRHYQVPDLYGGTNRVSRWDKFGLPPRSCPSTTRSTRLRTGRLGDHRVVAEGRGQERDRPQVTQDGDAHPC